jgi:hypothetical protein
MELKVQYKGAQTKEEALKAGKGGKELTVESAVHSEPATSVEGL